MECEHANDQSVATAQSRTPPLLRFFPLPSRRRRRHAPPRFTPRRSSATPSLLPETLGRGLRSPSAAGRRIYTLDPARIVDRDSALGFRLVCLDGWLVGWLLPATRVAPSCGIERTVEKSAPKILKISKNFAI
uniref:Uncharacterized protein n=1 Tax=Oryza punctata TaxID=4537 RepID=A0A0E0JW08_ORYPU